MEFGSTVRRVGLAGMACGSLLLAPAPPGWADVISIPATRDNTLYSESADTSNGAGEHIFAGSSKDGFQRRALLAFDVSGAIPAGSRINGVTLTLYMSRTRTQDEDVALHRVLSAWGEGASHAGGEEGAGAQAEVGDATWLYRFYDPLDPPGSPAWAVPGGDFDVLPSALTTVGNQMGYYAWSGAGLVADVQAWLDGTQPDHGWIVVGNEIDTRVAKRFDSRQNTDASHRPELLVDFTPAATVGACCDPDGSCSVVLDPGTACSGSYEGANTSCSPNPCPQPTGACCLPDAAATCLEDTAAACVAQGGTPQGDFTTCSAALCPVVLTPFLDPLPRPAVAQPVAGSPGGAASYELAMREVQQQLHSQLSPTTVWGYGDGPSGATYPGPTIEAAQDERVQVTWINDLRDTSQPGSPLRTSHYLSVDTCPHGAALNQDARVVVHLHGGHVSAAADGHPDQTFPPGQQVTYEYGNDQLPATLWYHDHALGITRLNVYMGLAGFYLLRDPVEQALGLPSGEFEIPLVVQDRSFNPDGSLQYPASWQDHFFGNTILVNGKVWPYLDVKQGKYRFRILDGSGSRTYTLSLSTGASFQQIGAEGGLLPAPVTLSEVTLGPGERADVVIDFEPYAPGTEIRLVNSAPAPFPGSPGVGVIPDVMKFVVTSQAGHTAPVPAALRTMEVLQEADATVVRDFHLEKGPGDACSPFEWLVRSVVNGQVVGEHWDDVTELPQLGTTEVWRFFNLSGLTHPMHMHLVMFQVLDRQAFDVVNGQINPIGSPVPPPAHEAGWKDTVQVGPNEVVRVIARFANPLDPADPTYVGLFPYHCHILEHEDHEMMRQFQTTTTCGDGVVGRPDEECDDGGTVSGDGCSATCQIEECLDGVDNDGDGLVDFAGGDPGCSSAAADLSERDAALPCDDGVDNDGDGWIDYVADANGDGISDYPGDPGCRDPQWSSEQYKCQDGSDNDGDGLVDFDGGESIYGACANGACPAGVSDANADGVADRDPQCTGVPWLDREKKKCGLGAELVLMLAPLWLAHRRRRRAASS